MIRRLLFAIPCAVFAACAGLSGQTTTDGLVQERDAAEWVEATLASLTLREKVGQMVFPWVSGEYTAVDGPVYDRLRAWVEDQGIGGVVMSIGPPLEVASKLNLLQGLAGVPLLVAADMEHGPGQRLDAGVALPWGLRLGGGTRFPPVMAFGAVGDEALAYELGRITALEARAAGVHMTFAPVVDVNNNADNPIINTRSYGEKPHEVARLAAAHIRGLQEHGLLATAKHFPGHGDTELDSHLVLPYVGVDRARADSVELVPFRAAVDAGVAAVMSAHIAFPAITGDSVPATLSPALMIGLLQHELGFRGLVVTDALDMGAIVTEYGADAAAVLAVHAGADVLLMPPDVATAVDAVESAVERGEIAEARIDESVRKLLRAKAELGLHRSRTVELDRIPHVVGRRAHHDVAEAVAERSLTLVRDRDRLLPINPVRTPRVLSIVYTDRVDPVTGRTLNAALAERLPGLETVALDARSGAAEFDAVEALAEAAHLVLFSPFVRVIAYRGEAAIDEEVAAFVDRLAGRRPVVVTSFGNPYVLRQVPRVGTYLLAWGPEDIAQRAAARALMGEIPVTGRLPISLPPDHLAGGGERRPVPRGRVLTPAEPHEAGFDPRLLARADSVLLAATASGVTPGAALAVGRGGRLVLSRGYGRLDSREGFGPATDSTIYDLASLTKVVATTTAVMLLVEEGRLELDAPVARYLPRWNGADKDRVTLRDLLTHRSGLPAYGPLWRELRGRDAFLKRLAAMSLDEPPGQRTVYSDFGMIVAAMAAEEIAGRPLDELLEARVFGPLGMRDTRFVRIDHDAGGYAAIPSGGNHAGNEDAALDAPPPGAAPAGAGEAGVDGIPLHRVAPTEIDTAFRGTHVHGVVHDENAFALGGVAGHAGLFSSARDLAVFAQMLLNGGAYGEHRIVSPGTVTRFIARQSEDSSRALGWETPSGRSSAGEFFSERSFGHTGFTGTSIWIDPERDLFVVLLTNRVNPTRDNDGHISLRRAIHDAVQQAIVDAPVRPRAE